MARLVSGLRYVGILVILFVSISDSSAEGNMQMELLARIDALEKQGREQAVTITTQAVAMKAMETNLEFQNDRIQNQDRTMEEFKHKIKQLETAVEHLQQNGHENRENTADEQAETRKDNDKEKQEISLKTRGESTPSLKSSRLVLGGESPVAFHAVLKKTVEVNHIGLNQKVLFPDVHINLGNGYSNQHGIFTAPVQGIYLFSTSILSYSVGHVEIYVHLMKNGEILANAYAHGDSGRHDQGSVTVVTQLAVGDQVWVSLYGLADTSMWGDNFDSFMGCLVFAL